MLQTEKTFNWCSEVKASTCNAGDLGSIPGLGRCPGEGNGNPLQYSCLENPMDGGAWWATVHGVANSRTQLSDFTFTLKQSNHTNVIKILFYYEFDSYEKYSYGKYNIHSRN